MASKQPRQWVVDAVDEFADWLAEQSTATQEKVEAMSRLLEEHGPSLGRPYVDRIQGSDVHNLKELRPSSSENEALRILFYFDPIRRAVLLVGGDKAGDWSGWYDTNIPIAEQRIAAHETSLKQDQAKTKPDKPKRPRRKR